MSYMSWMPSSPRCERTGGEMGRVWLTSVCSLIDNVRLIRILPYGFLVWVSEISVYTPLHFLGFLIAYYNRCIRNCSCRSCFYLFFLSFVHSFPIIWKISASPGSKPIPLFCLVAHLLAEFFYQIYLRDYSQGSNKILPHFPLSKSS